MTSDGTAHTADSIALFAMMNGKKRNSNHNRKDLELVR